METEAASIWKECLGQIEHQIGTENFYTWLACSELIDIEGDTAAISLPNRFVADWVRKRYSGLIDSTLSKVTGSALHHRFEIRPNGNGNGAGVSSGHAETHTVNQISADTAHLDRAATERAICEARLQAQLNPRFNFESFVVGQSNQLAHAAAMAVAEMPGRTRYNPLCLYGSVGLGKTHLAQAIGNAVLENCPGASVLYVTSEKFTNDFIDSLSRRTTSAFVTRYRSVDVLLIDDIQFFAGKESTQEQFFHTFNTLHQNARQIVLTADRAPRDIKGLEERLLSRFQWGLAADIRPPDFETRMAILRKKLEGEDIILPPDVLAHVARYAQANIRELEGALVRLLAVSSLNGTPVTLETAQSVLRDTLSPARKPITIKAINAVVASAFGVEEPVLFSKRRTQDVAMARQVAMYLARTLTSMSLKAIGAEYGGRDHSTVIHGVSVVRDAMKDNAEFKLRVDQVISTLHGAATP